MPTNDYSKNIVYLSKEQYQELITNETLTVNGQTITYNDNDIYVTPQAEPITDVKINGTSIGSNGVAEIPVAGNNVNGTVNVSGNQGLLMSSVTPGLLMVKAASSGTIKSGTDMYTPIVPPHQHESAFYGLAKAAGHDEKNSTEPLGTYTPEAKGAIQKMLGVSDLIATEENNLIASKAYAIGDVFTANGKLYKATAAIAVDAAIIPAVEGEEIEGANCEETSIGEGFVKKTDYATGSKGGVVKVSEAMGVSITNGYLSMSTANSSYIQDGTHARKAIPPLYQHEAVYFGLSKLAGVDLANETVTLGTYPETSKAAIRSMIGAENGDDIVKIQDTEPTTAATKIWLPATPQTSVEVPTVAEMETALAGKVGDVQIDGTSIVSNGIANFPMITSTTPGIAKVDQYSVYGINVRADGTLQVVTASDTQVKSGNAGYDRRPITPSNQHASTFYGLAKAAGDSTQSVSDNAVGTYTDEAKVAIKSMIGVNVEDVQIDGTSIITNEIANIPIASASNLGVVKIATNNDYGIGIYSNGILTVLSAGSARVKSGTSTSTAITPSIEHEATFYGLAKAAGDTTQSASSNAVGTYTDNAKASIKAMLGIQDGSTGTVDISGTTPTITAVENTRYVCGEVTSLSFTPPASGISIVRFTSGSTVTVLTIPSTVKFPEWFDPTSLETNTIYEICVTDGEFGAVMSWAL